jgi:hypothetical protein
MRLTPLHQKEHLTNYTSDGISKAMNPLTTQSIGHGEGPLLTGNPTLILGVQLVSCQSLARRL